jgi:hypothetical protein
MGARPRIEMPGGQRVKQGDRPITRVRTQKTGLSRPTGLNERGRRVKYVSRNVPNRVCPEADQRGVQGHR